MKRVAVVALGLFLAVCCAGLVFAADKEDDIKSQVDEIAVALEGGKKAEDFTEAANREPYYVFIMKEDGHLLVHPSLSGESLKEKAEPVYAEVSKATPEGNWVEYVWKDSQKHTYVRKTKDGLIVGSGYSE